ncbi:MAG: ABC transporter permease [Fusobacteriaceae bacterium]
MNTNIKIALNFIGDNKRQTFSIIVGISMGIAIQFFMINLVPSLQEYLVDKTLGNSYHIKIEEGESKKVLIKKVKDRNSIIINGNSELSRNRITDFESTIKVISELEEVKNVAGYLGENGLYSKNGKSRSMIILGSEYTSIDKIYHLSERIVEGGSNLDSDNIIVGIDFLKDYNLEINDIITLQLGNEKNERFRISGAVDLGNAISNKNWIFMNLTRAQYIFDKKGFISTIDVQLKDPFMGDSVAEYIENRFFDLEARSWTVDLPDLLAALKSQSMTTIIIQVFITLATSLSISSILGITVLQKSKQLGILKTIGLSDSDSMKIFIYEGAIFGIIATFVGIVFGLIIIGIFYKSPSIAFPITVKLKYSILISIISIISSIIASIIPALKSKNINPIDIIRGN